ncbi:unnamed protein product [Bursaphelenchus okinawaensis]|uniref:Uncharacterized protein n=1 Tax=Bursaphelenchus okinawaensis TaxID=465554 RepID=A0A811L2T1_9BILA|nr:unnamed protein product [Bursaphelenchus okinawaensis]CAG9115083.1 unnamed protein product [Bursaphelenchus okinawaensis]
MLKLYECEGDTPRELLEKLLKRLADPDNSILWLFARNSDYDKKVYDKMEKMVIENVQILRFLVAFGAGLLHDNETAQLEFEDCNLIVTEIYNALLRARQEGLNKLFWPDSVRKMARAEIDKDGFNADIVYRIFKQFKLQFPLSEKVFVAVFDGILNHEKYFISDQDESAIFELR